MKVAVIGAGRKRNGIGEYIAKYFHKNKARVMALLGTTVPTAEKASQNLKKYGIEAIPYTDFAQMVDHEQPDAIVIASPLSTHTDYLTKCVDAGVNIFCEKPFIRPETADIKGTIEGVFKKAKEKKLTIAMNSQLSFTLQEYEKLCGSCQVEQINKFTMNMAPPRPGKEIITESIPHVLSLLYCGLGDGQIDNLTFESDEPDKMTIRFKYIVKSQQYNVTVFLAVKATPPRDLSFGFNDRIVKRTIDTSNYDMYFNYDGKSIKINDPLESSVKDFIGACKEKREPQVRTKHILSNMVLLKQIYDGYEKVN